MSLPEDIQVQSNPRVDSRRDAGDAWLARPSSIRLLWRVFAVVLALCVLIQFAFPVKGYFEVDSWFAFGAVFGFLSCLIMVLFAKALGHLLKRGEDYYREDEDV